MEREEIKSLAEELAEELNETKPQPKRQIELLLEHMGEEFVRAKIEEAKKVEADGGMMVDDGSRRRTLGGVFFYVAKLDVPIDRRLLIFPNFGQAKRGKVIEWHERHEYIDKLLDADEHGDMQYVKTMVQGRPGKIEIMDNSVVTTIQHIHRRIPMPRGVPFPPDTPMTYVIYMSLRHWEKVKESLEKYNSDKLIAEGTCIWDDETETFAVFANHVTTRRMDTQAQKEEQAQGDDADKPAKPDKASAKAATSTDQPADKTTKSAKKETKETQDKKAQTTTPAPPKQAEPASAPQAATPVSDSLPPKVATKLRQLHSAADKLRARIAEMEAKGSSGVAMTKKLLANTERQIKQLEDQHRG
jgi:hypothetical protein